MVNGSWSWTWSGMKMVWRQRVLHSSLLVFHYLIGHNCFLLFGKLTHERWNKSQKYFSQGFLSDRSSKIILFVLQGKWPSYSQVRTRRCNTTTRMSCSKISSTSFGFIRQVLWPWQVQQANHYTSETMKNYVLKNIDVGAHW